MRQNRDIRDVYYTVPETRVYEAGEGRGLIRRRYTAGARIPMAVALQFGMPGAEERAPTPGGVLETEESTQVDPANSDTGEANADNATGTGDVNSTDAPPVNSTDTSDENVARGLRPTNQTDEERAIMAELEAEAAAKGDATE